VRISIGAIAVVAMAITNMSVALAGDPAAATSKAKTLCAACHGPDGVSMNPLWPNLAGQKEQYMAKALTDYRAGNRTDPTMAPLAKTLTDKEIEDLAAYYAGL
jgi:cytochrome c553